MRPRNSRAVGPYVGVRGSRVPRLSSVARACDVLLRCCARGCALAMLPVNGRSRCVFCAAEPRELWRSFARAALPSASSPTRRACARWCSRGLFLCVLARSCGVRAWLFAVLRRPSPCVGARFGVEVASHLCGPSVSYARLCGWPPLLSHCMCCREATPQCYALACSRLAHGTRTRCAGRLLC